MAATRAICRALLGVGPAALSRPAGAIRMLAKKAPSSGGSGKKGRNHDEPEEVDEDVVPQSGKGGKKRPDAAAVPALGVADTEAALKDIAASFAMALSHIRHSSPAMLEGLEVEVAGKRTPLSRLAQVGVKDKATLSVLVFDPEHVGAVEARVRAANLQILREGAAGLLVPLPRMTAEYRQTLVTQAKDAAERAKGRIRDQRNKAVKQFRGIKTGVSEDDIRRLETEADKLATKASSDVDALLKKKSAELEKLQ